MALLQQIRRGFRKPPHVIARRLMLEVRRSMDRVLLPLHITRIDATGLVRTLGAVSLENLWRRLARRSFPMPTRDQLLRLDEFVPGETARILRRANAAADHRVDLLGSGEIALGAEIDWHKDYKTNLDWPRAYVADLDYVNADRPSDVKFPWEVSRLQWLMPVGQAYLLTGDERWAKVAKNILSQWMQENPCGYGVNWACTMEVAMRIFTWTWLFHAFHASPIWDDPEFRGDFLATLYQHGRYTDQYLEYSDINGNHCTADGAGLVWCGLFFGQGRAPERWVRQGWRLLEEELRRQVTPDGVDFEASVPYHRLVAELFFLPAMYREQCGGEVSKTYRTRVAQMGRFVQAYSDFQGRSPIWGDGDDGRTLPFGSQALTDHRYVAGQIGVQWGEAELCSQFSGDLSEVFWLQGPEACERLKQTTKSTAVKSAAFREGGFFVLRNELDHVFIDCGSVGMGGRGGHGHNDCLAFEAKLLGKSLIVDRGCVCYTASFDKRNEYRATAAHNTPRIDETEINPLNPNNLWMLGAQAIPELRRWETGTQFDLFQGAHAGYQRLSSPVTPVRTICLDHEAHALLVRDEFEGSGEHRVEMTFTLAADVQVENSEPGRILLRVDKQVFECRWSDSDQWRVSLEETTVSPSYGVELASRALRFERQGSLCPFVMCLLPQGQELPEAWKDLWDSSSEMSVGQGGRR